MTHKFLATLVLATILEATTLGQRNVLRSPTLNTEIAIGRQAANNVEARVVTIRDSAIIEYVNRIGQKLVRNSSSDVSFDIRVTNSNEISLVALPGGFLFVSTSLLLVADTEDELAAILSHGIAHVTARHAFGQREQASSLASRVSIEALTKASALGVPIEFLQFTTIDEEEADRICLENLIEAGYDGRAILDATRKLQSANIPTLFETHVLSTERADQVEQIIKSKGQPSKIPDRSPDFQNMKKRLETLTARKSL